jgi:hypothetical protein
VFYNIKHKIALEGVISGISFVKWSLVMVLQCCLNIKSFIAAFRAKICRFVTPQSSDSTSSVFSLSIKIQ